MARYFIDTEFSESIHNRHIMLDLISIGISAEDGRGLYLQSCEFDPLNVSPWVVENVFPYLDICPYPWNLHRSQPKKDVIPHDLQIHKHGQCLGQEEELLLLCPWRNQAQMTNSVRQFIGDGNPEFVTWCGCNDYFLLCQIFGGMMQLPAGWPHSICDIQQELDKRGIPDDQLPSPIGRIEHHALADARYIQFIWQWLQTWT